MTIEAVGTVDLAVVLMGSNDIVQEPDRIDELTDEACLIGRQLIKARGVLKVAFVEDFHQLKPIQDSAQWQGHRC